MLNNKNTISHYLQHGILRFSLSFFFLLGDEVDVDELILGKMNPNKFSAAKIRFFVELPHSGTKMS